MLPKINRLTRPELEGIKRAQKVIIQGRYFGLLHQPKPGGAKGGTKFGVIISNNISKKAVLRNRLKRLLYRFIEKHLLTSEGSFLFLAKRPSLGMSIPQAEEEILFFKNKLK